MGKYQDLSGKRFGELIVIRRVDNVGKYAAFLCRCNCGNEKVVSSHSLKQGNTKSCGCLLLRNQTHGMSKSKLYNIWIGMKYRCYRPTARKYKHYGGRGITVCDEWKDNFQAFYEWAMANGYRDDLSIDRIDADGNYEPSNCRWTDAFTQRHNRRLDKKYTYNGKTQSAREWCKEIGFYWNIFPDNI